MFFVLGLELLAIHTVMFCYTLATNRMIVQVTLLKKLRTQLLCEYRRLPSSNHDYRFVLFPGLPNDDA